jgi:protein-S-isoprenylcysteine O-methyltransferase Ste14
MRRAALVIGRGVVAVAILGVVGGRAAITHPIALAFLAIEAVWSLAEGTLARRELGQTREQRMKLAQAPMSDAARKFLFAGKRYFLANIVYQAIVLGEFARRAAVTPRVLGSATIAGLAVYAFGAIVRGRAMSAMGERFKSWTVTREGRGVETGGAYAMVRHPSYLGLLLIAIALPLIFGQPWLLLVALLPIATIAGRVGPEEALLREAYGEEYAVYASRTRARLIPGVW